MKKFMHIGCAVFLMVFFASAIEINGQAGTNLYQNRNYFLQGYQQSIDTNKAGIFNQSDFDDNNNQGAHTTYYDPFNNTDTRVKPIDYSAQNHRWEIKIGDSHTKEYFNAMAECYDQGYKVLTWKGNSNGGGTVLKTDKNGNLLYEKIFDHLDGQFSFTTIAEDSLGNFYAGGFFAYNKSLPFVMKFNSCGEQVWCKYVRHGFSGGVMDLVINKNNQLITLLDFSSGDTGDQIYLAAFDLDGNELWKNAYAKK